MLDAVIDYLPAPDDVFCRKQAYSQMPPKLKFPGSPPIPSRFAALAFKIATDPFVGSLTFFPGLFPAYLNPATRSSTP